MKYRRQAFSKPRKKSVTLRGGLWEKEGVKKQKLCAP